MKPLPSLYLSHGSPMIAITRSEASDFLDRLGPLIEARFGRPKAALVVSPHSATREPMALAGPMHDAIHDFGGFPRELYEQRYDAEGNPALAARAVRLLREAGVTAHLADASGLDHGIWTLLQRMWPKAEVPVMPLTLVPNWSPQRQWAVGQALAPLAAEGVLVIGSGAMTHNLQRFFGLRGQVKGVEPDVAAFQDWVHGARRRHATGKPCSTTAGRPPPPRCSTPPTNIGCRFTWPQAQAERSTPQCASTRAWIPACWRWTAMPSDRVPQSWPPPDQQTEAAQRSTDLKTRPSPAPAGPVRPRHAGLSMSMWRCQSPKSRASRSPSAWAP
jgi:4,5-DOPA dioxygenase extradiol